MLDISLNAGRARQSDLEIRHLEDLHVLRKLEGTIDAPHRPCSQADILRSDAQNAGTQRLSPGSYGYP